MDDSSYRLNFDLGKKNEIHITRGKMHHIWAESAAFSRA
jgi:hypothetical protein